MGVMVTLGGDGVGGVGVAVVLERVCVALREAVDAEWVNTDWEGGGVGEWDAEELQLREQEALMGEWVGVARDVTVSVWVWLRLGVRVAKVGVCVSVVAVRDSEGLDDGVGVSVAVGERLKVGGDGERVPVRDVEAVLDGEGVAVVDRLPENVWDLVGAVGDSGWVGLEVGGERVSVTVGVRLQTWDGDGEVVSVTVVVGRVVGVGDGDRGLAVAVGEKVGEQVCVLGLSVADGEVRVGSGRVGVREAERLAVRVGVGEGVPDHKEEVMVYVVLVRVAVGEGPSEMDRDRVCVAERVRVGGDGDGVGAPEGDLDRESVGGDGVRNEVAEGLRDRVGGLNVWEAVGVEDADPETDRVAERERVVTVPEAAVAVRRRVADSVRVGVAVRVPEAVPEHVAVGATVAVTLGVPLGVPPRVLDVVGVTTRVTVRLRVSRRVAVRERADVAEVEKEQVQVPVPLTDRDRGRVADRLRVSDTPGLAEAVGVREGDAAASTVPVRVRDGGETEQERVPEPVAVVVGAEVPVGVAEWLRERETVRVGRVREGATVRVGEGVRVTDGDRVPEGPGVLLGGLAVGLAVGLTVRLQVVKVRVGGDGVADSEAVLLRVAVGAGVKVLEAVRERVVEHVGLRLWVRVAVGERVPLGLSLPERLAVPERVGGVTDGVRAEERVHVADSVGEPVWVRLGTRVWEGEPEKERAGLPDPEGVALGD